MEQVRLREPKEPKFIKLTGRTFRYYNAGVNCGAAEALKDCAAYLENVQERMEEIMVKVPENDPLRIALTSLLASGAVQIRQRSKKHLDRGNLEIAHLHSMQLEADNDEGSVMNRFGTVAAAVIIVFSLIASVLLAR